MDLVAAAQLSFPVVCTDASLLSNCSAHVIRQYPGSVALKCDQRGCLSFGVFLIFFLSFSKKTSVALLKLWEVEDFVDLGDPVPKKSYHHLGLSPMRPNEPWTCAHDGAARAQAPGCPRSSFGSVRR